MGRVIPRLVVLSIALVVVVARHYTEAAPPVIIGVHHDVLFAKIGFVVEQVELGILDERQSPTPLVKYHGVGSGVVEIGIGVFADPETARMTLAQREAQPVLFSSPRLEAEVGDEAYWFCRSWRGEAIWKPPQCPAGILWRRENAVIALTAANDHQLALQAAVAIDHLLQSDRTVVRRGRFYVAPEVVSTRIPQRVLPGVRQLVRPALRGLGQSDELRLAIITPTAFPSRYISEPAICARTQAAACRGTDGRFSVRTPDRCGDWWVMIVAATPDNVIAARRVDVIVAR